MTAPTGPWQPAPGPWQPTVDPVTGYILVPLTTCCGDLPDHCLCAEDAALLAAAPVIHFDAGRAAA